MSSWAAPGVKCVCKNTSGLWYLGPDRFQTDIRPGVIYTIVSIVEDSRGQIGLGLWGQPLGEYYNVNCFEPLISPTQEQDLEHFHHLLKTKELVE